MTPAQKTDSSVILATFSTFSLHLSHHSFSLGIVSPGSSPSLYPLPKTPPSFTVPTMTTFRPCVCVCVCVLVAQLCPTLCDPTDCSPPGFSVHGILQARILEWIAIPFSRVTSQPRNQTLVSCMAGRFFTVGAQGSRFHLQMAKNYWQLFSKPVTPRFLFQVFHIGSTIRIQTGDER